MVRWLDRTVAVLLAILLMADGLYLHDRYQTQLNVEAHQGVRAAMQVVQESSDQTLPVIVLQPCLYFSARYHAADRNPRSVIYIAGERSPLYGRPYPAS
ncbi:MAG: hypothetical protein R3C49_21075 [Planctomycetaceae bacterium]